MEVPGAQVPATRERDVDQIRGDPPDVGIAEASPAGPEGPDCAARTAAMASTPRASGTVV